MKIPQEIIDRIHEHIDIADVIGDFVSLKKKGQYMMACCPFHNEKTPSFTVTPAKGIYKCFGCGKAGDAIQFVMDLEGLNYMEAMKYFARKYAIEIPEGNTERDKQEAVKQNERESLYIVLNYAKNYFQKLLFENEEGQSVGMSYFKERGFNEKTIRKFELGYSLEEWDGMLKQALKEGFTEDILEKAGLIIARDNTDGKTAKKYDRFRGRVIFPIHSVTGKVIAFGARILKTDKNQPKYLNSPETEVYHKSKILYGIYQARTAIRQEDNCYLVEGYTDVISLNQAGIENVVASSGTSLTEDQIRLIARYTNNITVLYDGDPAGIKASLRGIDMILEEGMNVSVVLFPDKEDPDSYVRRIGGVEFKNYILTAKKDFITFKTQLYLEDANKDPFKKAEIIKEIMVSISKIPEPIKRAVFLKECSHLLKIEEGLLIAELNKIYLTAKQKDKGSSGRNDFGAPPPPPPPFDFQGDFPPGEDLPPVDMMVPSEYVHIQPKQETDVVALQEKEVLRLLVNYGKNNISDEQNLTYYMLQEMDDVEFQHPLYSRILEAIRAEVRKGDIPGLEFFARHEDAEIRSEVIEMATIRHDLSQYWESKHQIFPPRPVENLGTLAYSAILRLKWRNIQKMIKMNVENLMKTTDPYEQQELQKIHIRLKEAEKQIAAMLGNVIAR